MRILKFTYFVLLIGFVLSCKKDQFIIPHHEESIEQSCSCEPLRDNEYISGLDYLVYDETYHMAPQMNPNNADEIAYTDGQDPYTEIKLAIFNTATQQKRILVNEPINNFFSWSKKDWILFQRTADFNLYKVKSNGDSLTQLTSDGQWFHAQWNYDGDRFIAFNKSSTVYPRTFILDEDANVVDTLAYWSHNKGYWDHPSLYVGTHTDRLIIMNPETEEVVKEMKSPFPNRNFKGVGWVSLDKIFFSVGQTFFTYSISTDKVEEIYCKCHQYIQAVSHSYDFSTLVFNRQEFSLLGEDDILVDSKLIWMRANGENEHEVIIP